MVGVINLTISHMDELPTSVTRSSLASMDHSCSSSCMQSPFEIFYHINRKGQSLLKIVLANLGLFFLFPYSFNIIFSISIKISIEIFN